MHEHTHDHVKSERRLAIALVITALYMVAEVAGGLVFNSLALLADAGHMLSDTMALGLAWVAFQVGKRVPTARHTFGFRRTEILAALLNGLILWAIVAVICYEAVHRLVSPPAVQGGGMLMIALVGLAVNLGMAALLFEGRKENLNIRGAFLHVSADALGSLGAGLAGAIILFTSANWVDPLASFLIGGLVLYSSWGLVRDSVHILMEGVPTGLSIDEIEQALIEQQGVCCIYDLHVWSITSDRHALSAHLVLAEPERDPTEMLKQLNELLWVRFRIDHTTLQLEATHEMRAEAEGLVCRAGTACAVNNRVAQ
ncbi:MAG: cation diffusion facilitator family transporter [Thermodesulfobacteriota bacterium]